MLKERIGIIGAGKIGSAIVRGVIGAGLVSKDQVMASDVSDVHGNPLTKSSASKSPRTTARFVILQTS